MHCRVVGRSTLTLALILFSLFPKIAFSLGFGQITLHSYLNEPLKAEIELLSTEDIDLSQLVVSLASADDFKKVELPRPFFLTKMKFQVVTEKDKSHILVTTIDAMKQPSIEFLVVLSWTEGRLVRGYTLLFDPSPLNPIANTDNLTDKNLENLFNPTESPVPVEETPIVRSKPVSIESAPAPAPMPVVPAQPTSTPIAPVTMVNDVDLVPDLLEKNEDPIKNPLMKFQIFGGILIIVFFIGAAIYFRQRKNRLLVTIPKEVPEENLELFDQEIQIKLDLANQYFLIQDISSAQELLVDILSRGNIQEREAAKELLKKISLLS